MTAVLRSDRTPAAEPCPFLLPALGSSHSRTLHQTNRIGNSAAICGSEKAFRLVEIASCVDRHPLHFPCGDSSAAPRIVSKLEDRADRTIGYDLPRLEVVPAVNRIVLPDRCPACTKGLADIEEVGTFSGVDVVFVVTFRVPLLDDEPVNAFWPHVDSVARHRRRCLFQPFSVDAESDAIAFPRDVVARLIMTDEHTGFGFLRWNGGGDLECLLFARPEISEKKERIGLSIGVLVDHLRYHLATS